MCVRERERERVCVCVCVNVCIGACFYTLLQMFLLWMHLCLFVQGKISSVQAIFCTSVNSPGISKQRITLSPWLSLPRLKPKPVLFSLTDAYCILHTAYCILHTAYCILHTRDPGLSTDFHFHAFVFIYWFSITRQVTRQYKKRKWEILKYSSLWWKEGD